MNRPKDDIESIFFVFFPFLTDLSLVLGLVLACLLTFSNCTPAGSQEDVSHHLTRPMMGTLVEVVWRGHGDAKGADKVRLAMDKMEILAASMNLHDPDSELANINLAAGKKRVKISDDLFRVIEKSLEISQLTEGAFDITIGSLESIWGDIQWGRGGRLPHEGEIQQALAKVKYKQIVLNQQKKTVFLERQGARLDLGGIAKGYVVDHGLDWLNGKGIQNILINAGGDIRASGNKQHPVWRVGLQDPFEKGKLLGVFLIESGAIVTSGTYERFFEAGEKKYSHILNPDTGHPVTGLVSATVWADKAAFADALATALMVIGRKDGIAVLGRIRSAQGVFIEEDGTIWIDKDLKTVLKLRPLPERNSVKFF